MRPVERTHRPCEADQPDAVRSIDAWLRQFHIVVVIPCYCVEREIAGVLCSMPLFVRHIIVVDDASPDRTGNIIEKVAASDSRIVPLHHATNLGVGGAMLSGFRKALEIGAQIVVKMDGDGQMHVEDLPALVAPLIRGEADYTKGNRFRDAVALRQMPLLRRFGNTVSSVIVKAVTGYWHCFDPHNGYVAIRADVLAQLPLDTVDQSYFFEISMLQELNFIDAVVRDVPMPARYGSEVSHLSTRRVLREFPRPLGRSFLRRIMLKKFLNAVPRHPIGCGPLAPADRHSSSQESSTPPAELHQK